MTSQYRADVDDQDRAGEARGLFVSALRLAPTPRLLGWALVLSAPERYRRTLSGRLISTKACCCRRPRHEALFS